MVRKFFSGTGVSGAFGAGMWTLFTPVYANAAPATVLNHETEWTLGGDHRTIVTTLWRVRIDDPAGAAAGVSAPLGLDGARDRDAFIDDDILLVPADTRPGDVFTFNAVTTTPWRSATFRGAVGLPMLSARLAVRAPADTPVTVWGDSSALANPAPSGQAFELSWTDVPETGTASAVFGAWKDWAEAGAAVESYVTQLAVTREELGRDLAFGISATGAPDLIDRVRAAVKLDANVHEGWLDAAAPKETLRAGHGSAADRGIVALNLLRLAGFDARPVQFAAAGKPPLAQIVPGPAQFPDPAIVVFRDQGPPLWIDLAADYAAPADIPARIDGGTAWVAGRLPDHVGAPGVPVGTVHISGDGTIDIDGDVHWSATLSASGAAAEALRTQLAPLPAEGREELFRRMILIARPAARVVVTTSGVERTLQPLRITLTVDDPERMSPQGSGLSGEIPALIAPGLAAWLPPDLHVQERLVLSAPQPLLPVGNRPVLSTASPEVQISRWIEPGPARPTLVTDILRPYRTTNPEREGRAAAQLAAAAITAPRVAFQPRASPASVKLMRRVIDRPATEVALLAARAWSQANNGIAANQILQKALRSDEAAFVADVAAWDDPTRLDLLSRMAPIAETPGAQLSIALAFEHAGQARPAWLLAYAAHATPDLATRAVALLVMERTQGPRPDPAEDKEGNAAWREPSWLLEEARKAAPDASEVRLRLARASLADGRTGDAEVGIDPNADADSALLRARLDVVAAAPVREVLERLALARSLAPDRPDVASEAADIATLAGATEAAATLSLTAARLAPLSTSAWTAAKERALAAGQLASALAAATRASDLSPGDANLTHEAIRLATLAGDAEAVRRLRERAGNWTGADPGEGIDGLLALAGDNAAYAVLAHRDEETTASPIALAQRARFRLERGDLDGATRDGLLLLDRHARDEGALIAFAAMAGRTWSPSLRGLLPRAASLPEGKRLRLEWGLLTGSTTATADARALTDPASVLVARLLSSPGRPPDGATGWPTDLVQPSGGPPPGYRPNAALSAAPGVRAWSDPEKGAAHIRVGGIVGLLPPPFSFLRSADETPWARLPNGVQVLALRGDLLPLFAAAAVRDGEEVWGLATTPEAALAALGR